MLGKSVANDGHLGVDAADVRLIGVSSGDGAALGVSPIGDINGDGFGDIVIGAPYADEAGSSSGTTYVIFGG